jgi:CHRD domain
VKASKTVIAAIEESPSGYYVNIHTSDFPAGAIRGQL